MTRYSILKKRNFMVVSKLGSFLGLSLKGETGSNPVFVVRFSIFLPC